MEAKSLIRVLKMQRGKYAKNPNVESEKKNITNMVEKNGGKLEVIALLKENNEQELVEYVQKVLGIVKVKSTPKTKDESNEELYTGKDGKLYWIDTVKKTMRKVYKDLADINIEDIDLPEMNLQVYQRYLKDHFDGESCTMKKGKLHFRDYRISLSVENGFMIEDTKKKYAIVDTPFEGIPTPKELGEWFKRPIVEHTPEELHAAVERGKELARKAKEEAERNAEQEEVVEVDFEKLRRKVLKTIKDIRSKTLDFDPTQFPEMIPFKRWKRQANSLVSQWKTRKIRYAKFLNELERVTTEETFQVEEKKHRSKFVGTLIPEFNEVGGLKGDKIEVDGKWIDAVPFLLEYLLHHEPKAMSQIMKFAAGEITDIELIKNPEEVDWKIEYDKKALKNTEYNVQVLLMVYEAMGLTAPQDILYGHGLEVGDRILIFVDGEPKTKSVTKVEQGAFLGKSLGWLLKYDKWIRLPKKETK